MDSSSSESGDERPYDQFTEIDEKTGKNDKKDKKLVKYKLMVDDKSVTLIAETAERDSDDGYFDGSSSSGCSSDDDADDSGLDVADDRNDGPRRANILDPKNPNYCWDMSEGLAAAIVSRINATIDNVDDDTNSTTTSSSSSSSDSEDDRSSIGSSESEECWEDEGYENAANIDDETASNCGSELGSDWGDDNDEERETVDSDDDRSSSTSDVVVDGEFPDDDQWNLSSETAVETAAVETAATAATVTVAAATVIGSPERSLLGNRLPRRPTPNWDLDQRAATAEEPNPEFARVREMAQKNLNAKIAELERRKRR